MKNLFKNLMLVAVAAMAFTSCSQDVNELNKLERKTVYNFQANIADDDTRSGFMEKEDGATAYKSEWFGDETIKIFVNYNDYNAVTTASINAEGKFSFELTDAPENFFVTVCSPAESWESEYTAIIPTEQTPLANSVDPKAHLLNTAGAVYVQNGVADKINMTHQVAYGKMTVKGVDFEIDHVVVDLKGSFFGSARELSYTINADNVDNNTFWFATEPIDVAEFTVTAYDADNAVAKTVDVAAAGKTLSFNYGRVSTFSVSGLEEVEVVTAFTRAELVQIYTDTDVMVEFSGDGLENMLVNFCDIAVSEYILQPGEFSIGYGLYNGYCYYGDYNLDTCTASVSFVDGEYNIVFTDLTCGSEILPERLTYNGLISEMDVLDTREKLATPSATATAEGNVITISWDKVTGADEYYVFCYVGGLEAVTTTETSVTIEAAYNTSYEFLIRAVANDSNPDYKSSEDYYFYVTTEKDPNAVLTADYTATNIVWNNSEQRFEFIGADLQYFYIKMNAEDRPNNNSFAVGEYTGIGSRNVGVKQFSVSQKVNYAIGWTDTSNASTMSIEVKNGEYVIYIAYLAAYNQGAFTLMYKGLPDGFVLPDGTGGGGETPELPTIKDQYNVTWSYELESSSSGVYGHLWTVTSGDGGFYAKVGTDSNCTTPTSFTLGEYEYHTQFADGPSGPGFTMRSIQIEGVEYRNNDIDGKMVVAIEDGAYAITIDLYKKADGSKITTLVGTFGNADSGSGDNTGDGENTGGGGNTDDGEWSGRDVKLNLLAYDNNSLYTNVNGEGKYFKTEFRNGIVAGTFVLAGDNKSYEILSSGHATSQNGLFSGTTPFADGDTVEVIDNGGGSYTIIYRVTVNDEKLTATYNGGL